MEQPTDKYKQEMLEDYEKSLINLRKLGLIQLVDGGVGVRITDKGMRFMKLQEELENGNRD